LEGNLGHGVIGVGSCDCARSTSPATTTHCSAPGPRICIAPRRPSHTRRCRDSANLHQTGQEAAQARQAAPRSDRIAGSKAVLSGAFSRGPDDGTIAIAAVCAWPGAPSRAEARLGLGIEGTFRPTSSTTMSGIRPSLTSSTCRVPAWCASARRATNSAAVANATRCPTWQARSPSPMDRRVTVPRVVRLGSCRRSPFEACAARRLERGPGRGAAADFARRVTQCREGQRKSASA
jgi:hypothetical protein